MKWSCRYFMFELIYGYSLEEWNKLTESEQINIQNNYEYDLFHSEQLEWFID